jgi:hypothetical protein
VTLAMIVEARGLSAENAARVMWGVCIAAREMRVPAAQIVGKFSGHRSAQARRLAAFHASKLAVSLSDIARGLDYDRPAISRAVSAIRKRRAQ